MENLALSAGAASLCSPDTHFLWEPPEQPISVYVRFDVIDRLSAEAAHAGGEAVGGILLGRVAFDGKYEVMVEGFEPVPGEFWKGFPTQPEGEARKHFDVAYSRWRPGTEQPLIALGYYRISGDDPLSLTADDLFFIARYFSSPHNVILVVEPGSEVPSRATFFYWQHGQIQLEQGIDPFPMDSEAILEMLQPEPVPEESVQELVPIAEAAREAAIAAPAAPAMPRRPRWPWFALVTAGVLLIVAALAYVRLDTWNQPPSLVLARDSTGLLKVDRAGTDLRVNWDRGTPAVATAQRGWLAIADGDYKQELELDREQLLGGSLLYAPLTSDVTFRLRLFAGGDGRETTSASVRVLAGVKPQLPAENAARPAAIPPSAARPALSLPAGAPAGDGAVRSEPPARTPTTVFQPPPQRDGQPAQTLLDAPPADQVAARPSLPQGNPPIGSAANPIAPPPPAQPKPGGAETKPAPPVTTYLAPRPVRQVAPAMTPMLKQALRSMAGGTIEVEVRLELDATGNVTSATAVGGAQGMRKLFAELAADAARQWRFVPARRNGQAVASSTIVPFRFVPPPR